MKKIVLSLINYYRQTGGSKRWFATDCNFEPTCSTYTYDSIDRFGLYVGGKLAFKRIKNCNQRDTICKCIDPVTEEQNA